MSTLIRIFITDDHPIVRDGLRSVLETQSDFIIAGEAGSGQETLEQLERSDVDVLFLDLGMPQMNGVAVIEALQARQHPVRIIVFTVYDTDERILSAIKAGAKGYLLKGAAREELFNAVRVVHSGGSLLQPVVASRLMAHISKDSTQLSPRELGVLQLLAKGLSNQDIARALFISERTVKFHVSAILSKLGASNRTEAVQLALRQGLISIH
ncbi:MAG: response regulator transcription factor [Bacteroidota bacterium]